MRQLAQQHGQDGWHAHAFPLSVDGVEIVASLVLLADRRAGRRSGSLPWTALAAGTIGSLAANIATAHPDSVSRIVAGWPALALLLSVKLLSGLLEHRSTPSAPGISTDHPAAVRSAGRSTLIPDALLSSSGESPAEACPAHSLHGPVEPRDHQPSASPVATGEGFDDRTAVLLPAARTARQTLRRDGQALTRDALAARLRRDGYPIRNATLTPLLSQLRREQQQPGA